MSTPSVYNIDAWEDTNLLLISRQDVLELFQRCPAFIKTVKVMDDRNNIANQRMITSSISASTEKRYTDLFPVIPTYWTVSLNIPWYY